MNPKDKQELSDLLRDAISKEELRTGEVAKFLNLNPCYITFMLNVKYWGSAGAAPWERLKEWVDTRCKISEFKIPDGEQIWQPREKTGKTEEVLKINSTTGSVPQFKEPPMRMSKVKTEKPPQFNYDFLKDKKFINLKEKEADFMDLIARKFDEIAKKFNVSEQRFIDPVKQKVSIDIEINLVLNGQKINLK
jgi:hypothetical protein